VKTYTVYAQVTTPWGLHKGIPVSRKVWFDVESGLSWMDAKAKRARNRALRIMGDHNVVDG